MLDRDAFGRWLGMAAAVFRGTAYPTRQDHFPTASPT
jgi:hypothetical protein